MPSGSMPIEGVGTAIAAFVGFTEKYNADEGDPTDPSGVKPQLVTSWPQYERIYGGFVRGAMLPHAVRGFFDNGGSACYIVRIPTGNGDADGRGRLALPAAGRPEVESMTLTALNPGSRVEVEVVPPANPNPPAEGEQPTDGNHDYTFRVYEDGALREEIGGLTFTGKS